MCAKNHLLIFSSFLDIWENVEWPRFFWTTLYILALCRHIVRPPAWPLTFRAKHWHTCYRYSSPAWGTLRIGPHTGRTDGMACLVSLPIRTAAQVLYGT